MAIKRDFTPQERNFIAAYKETLNPAEAALRSYNCKSRENASRIGNRLLERPNIKRELAQHQKKMQAKFEMESEKALAVVCEVMANTANSASLRLRAATEVLDRAGYTKIERVAVSADPEGAMLLQSVANSAIARAKMINITPPEE